MKEESIDDIFKELDLIEENFENSRLDFSTAKEEVEPTPHTAGPVHRFESGMFFDMANEIKHDEDYISLRRLLYPNIYDFVDYDEELIVDKSKLKSNFMLLSLKYKYSSINENEDFSDLICEFNNLKNEELFKNDYFQYKQMVEVYLRHNKPEKGLEIILDFFDSQIYCNEIIFHYFLFCLTLFLRRLKINKSEEIGEKIRGYENNRISYKTDDSIPVADRIYKHRTGVYVVSEEKYEFNQALILLMIKAINVRWYCGYEYTVKFHVNLIDCEILYFKFLAFNSLGIIAKRMWNSDKFQGYLLKAMESKDSYGNILSDDFERIYSCKQIEIDFLNNIDGRTNEEKFNELFSDEYHR